MVQCSIHLDRRLEVPSRASELGRHGVQLGLGPAAAGPRGLLGAEGATALEELPNEDLTAQEET